MATRYYEFGAFRLDAKDRMLFRHGDPVPLPPKGVDTLLMLVEKAGAVIDKSEILRRVWKDAFVEEGSLTRTISLLRKALCETEQQYIATISRRGYRFVANVSRTPEEPSASSSDRLTLVVLPFENLSGDASQEYFSDGLTEEMITQLGRLNPERLGVIARTSSMKYKSTGKTVAEIGRELEVSYVFEGSVRRAGDRVRVTAQLIQVSDQTHVWAESYERNFGDILSLQSDVARAIAREIQVKLTPREEQRLAQTREVSPEAYEAYLKGRHLWNKRTEEGMQNSIQRYEEAIRQHPEFGTAYAGIADSYVMLACRGMMPAKETFRKARAAARKALDLDSELGEAHGSLAHVRLHDWDWEGLEKDFQRALELNPSQAIVFYWYGEFLMSRARPEEAIAVTQKAYQIDPLSPVIAASLAMILYLARSYDRAVGVLQRAQEIDAAHFLPHMRMGLVLVQQHKYDAAIAELKTAVNLADQSTESLAALGLAYAAAGRKTSAQGILRILAKLEGKRYVLPYNVAKIYAAAANREKAFHWLEKSYEESSPDLIELNSEPVFDGLRDDPRFPDLMRRIGWNV